MQANSHLPKRKIYLTETFESYNHEEKNSKFLMDSSIYRGIKDNDVSKIIDISKESGAITQKMYNQKHELQQIVIEMRKRYDEIRTNTKKLEVQIQKSHKIVQGLSEEDKQLSKKIADAKKDCENKQQLHSEMAELVQSRVYDLDIYKEIQNRLKDDILIHKKRNYDKEAELKKDSIKLKCLKQDEFSKTKMSYRCKDMLQMIEKTVMSKQIERHEKISQFSEALDRRYDNAKRKDEREREIEEVMMRAMSEKLEQQKQLINICSANLFLKKFLKKKMERLIAKNSVIESAYHKIRTNTNITNSKDLISRFLNRELDYGLLLQNISEKQQQLETLKTDKETLESAQHRLTVQCEHLHDNAARDVKEWGPFQKKLDQLNQQLISIKNKKQLMEKWALRFYSAYSGQPRQNFQKKYSGRTLKELLVDAISEIIKFSTRVIGEQNSSDKINKAFMSTRPVSKVFDDEMLVRNKRVKTTVLDEYPQVVEGEDRDGVYDGASEADYLQYNRRVTKKNDQSRRFRIKTQTK